MLSNRSQIAYDILIQGCDSLVQGPPLIHQIQIQTDCIVLSVGAFFSIAAKGLTCHLDYLH